MSHRRLLLVVPLLGAALPAAPPAVAQIEPASRSIVVAGDGVGTFPAFDAGTSRYALTGATGTDLTITVSDVDPDAVVRVDGRPAAGGVAHLSGLAAGDEVSVLLDDDAGHAAYAFFVTPDGFPTLERTTPDASLADVEPGQTLLTLGLFTAPSPFFETAVDANGVPVVVHENTGASNDLKLQPDGHYSVARAASDPAAGWDIVELGDDLQPIASYRMQGEPQTDSHDSLLLADGSRFLVGYEPITTGPDAGYTDAVIQQVTAAGDVWTWRLADHLVGTPAQDSMTADPDYAHINSISLTPDGDLLASFRHLSSVWKIALHDDPAAGVTKGDVLWRLGGRDSDFTFPAQAGAGDGTDGGPCAQHTATMPTPGHVLIWDNGSYDNPATSTDEAFCVDGDDPTGRAVSRSHTRVAEFALDDAAGTASLVWHYDEPNRFAFFAGSASRLANGDTLLGWAADRTSVAGEVGPDGTLLWNLRDTAPVASDRQITYRAAHAVVADWAAPVVDVETPRPGLVVDQDARVPTSYGCTDVGGSTLQTCSGTADSGAELDTKLPGAHTFTVSATDGAGHRTTATRHYTVRPASRPDVSARRPGSGWVGADRYSPATQRLEVRPGSCTTVRVQNDGVRTDRLTLRAVAPAKHWRLAWTAGGHAVTGQGGGRGRPTTLAPGRSSDLCLRVTRTDPARTSPTVTVRVVSALSGVSDVVQVRLRAPSRS